MGSGGGGTTTQKSEPWSGVQPYLTKGYQGAEQDILNKPFFPGQTYTDYSPETEAALGGITQRAMQGSPLTDMAQGRAYGMMGAPGTEFLTRTASGAYTGQDNPYMDQVAESVRSRVLPGVQSSFGMAGRTGDSPLAQGIIAREMTNALAPYQFGQYGQERGFQEAAASQLAGNQIAGMGMASDLANVDYADLARLGQVGGAREAKSMEELQDQMGRYENPVTRLNQYMQNLSGSAPLIGQTSQQQGPNPIFGALGAGISASPFFFM